MRDHGETPGPVKLGYGPRQGPLEVYGRIPIQLEADQVGDDLRVGLGPTGR